MLSATMSATCGLCFAIILGVSSAGLAMPSPATFESPVKYGIGSSTGTAFDIASGDFTGTKVKDIVVAGGAAGTVSLLAGRGNGTFAQPTIVFEIPGVNITAIAAADFNGDNRMDLAIVTEAKFSQRVVILLGDGHRHFSKSSSAPMRDLHQYGPFFFGGDRSLAVGRFTNQNHLDVVVTEGVNYISTFPVSRLGELGSRQDLLAAALPTSLLVVDLYNHGLADIGLVDNDSASVFTLSNRGDGSFMARQRTALGALPFNAQPVCLAGGDFRRLGRTDLFVVSNGTPPMGRTLAKVLLSDGHGGYSTAQDVRSGDPIFGLPWACAVGDFNGDHIPDLVEVIENFPRQNDVVVIPGIGNGNFSRAALSLVKITYAQNRVLVPDKMIVDDFNGDGLPDIAVALDRTNGLGVIVLIESPRPRAIAKK